MERGWGGVGGGEGGIPMMGIMGCYKNITEPHGGSSKSYREVTTIL